MSCERYESLDERFNDIYGTWELDQMGGGEFRLKRIFDQLTITKFEGKKVIGKGKKASKFADYQAELEGELVLNGEVYLFSQFDDMAWISFTDCGSFQGGNQIAIEFVDNDKLRLNSGYPSYYSYFYDFHRVSNSSQ